MSPRHSRKTWGIVFGVPVAVIAALDVHAALTHAPTLSSTIRSTYRVETPAGKVALVGSFLLLNAILVPHLLKLDELMEELS